MRVRPIRHGLTYRLFMGLFDLDELPALSRRHWAFGYNRPGFVSFYDRDHGDGSNRPLKQQIRAALEAAGARATDGPIHALCMPRVLGYVFNPLTVYFCADSQKRLTGIVYEVNNTYGERHFYALPLAADADGIVQTCDKAFRVSPFMTMDLRYRFNVQAPGELIGVNIVASDDQGPVLTATFSGRRRGFTSASIIRELMLHPAMTIKVIAGIHWEAVLIALKLRAARTRPVAGAQPSR